MSKVILAGLQVRHYPALIAFLGYYPFPNDFGSFAGQVRRYRFSHGFSHKRMGSIMGVDGSTIVGKRKKLLRPLRSCNKFFRSYTTTPLIFERRFAIELYIPFFVFLMKLVGEPFVTISI